MWTFDNNIQIIEGIGSELGFFEGITPVVNGIEAQLYGYCTAITIDCNVAVGGMVNPWRKFNMLNVIYDSGVHRKRMSTVFLIRSLEEDILILSYLGGKLMTTQSMRLWMFFLEKKMIVFIG